MRQRQRLRLRGGRQGSGWTPAAGKDGRAAESACSARPSEAAGRRPDGTEILTFCTESQKPGISDENERPSCPCSCRPGVSHARAHLPSSDPPRHGVPSATLSCLVSWVLFSFLLGFLARGSVRCRNDPARPTFQNVQASPASDELGRVRARRTQRPERHSPGTVRRRPGTQTARREARLSRGNPGSALGKGRGRRTGTRRSAPPRGRR